MPDSHPSTGSPEQSAADGAPPAQEGDGASRNADVDVSPGGASNGASSNGASSKGTSKNGASSNGSPALHERFSAYRAERREEREPRRPEVAVPSFFTLLNLFCGFLALTQVFEGEFTRACWLIVLAGFFDALDGLTARLADAQSLFGVELDSLSDVVSFGVAPAFLVWNYGLDAFGPLGMIVGALPALCGAVRLARYNVGFDGEKSDYFSGLPVPAQAVTMVALILTLESPDWFTLSGEASLPVLIPVVLILAGLMVSNVRFGAFPKPKLSYIRAHPYKVGAYVVGVFLLPFLQELALLLVLAGYILTGVVMSAYRLGKAVMNAPVEREERAADEG
jgi:CDP-diacylglycerol--serine O-phosphatidyltransferase